MRVDTPLKNVWFGVESGTIVDEYMFCRGRHGLVHSADVAKLKVRGIGILVICDQGCRTDTKGRCAAETSIFGHANHQ